MVHRMNSVGNQYCQIKSTITVEVNVFFWYENGAGIRVKYNDYRALYKNHTYVIV